MNVTGRVLALALIGASLGACWSIAPGAPARASAQTSCDRATISDPTQPIEVAVGRPIVVQQPANPTTGYEWLISGPPDPAVAQLTSDTYLAPPATNPPLAGQGGVQCWEFLAVGAGSTSFTIDYRRPFELANPDYQSVTFTILVDPAS